MQKGNILVTGANGQLGSCIRKVHGLYPELEFLFTDSRSLDICSEKQIALFFDTHDVDYLINCAAFTQVDLAEKQPDLAFASNAEAVKHLAVYCNRYQVTMIHISTDYVFAGDSNIPYDETARACPINIYGESKWKGEQYIQEALEQYFIIRTSWLYSGYGKNFYKTILEKSKTANTLTVTTSETGTPTYALDLANFLCHLVQTQEKRYGIFNFSNLGSATWYRFAEAILHLNSRLSAVNLQKTDHFPTLAKRPRYSVLDKSKIQQLLNYRIVTWEESLKKAINAHK